MAQEELFEYHLYTLGRPTTIGDNQTKQVAMLSGAGIPVVKEYRFVNIGTAYNYPIGDMARVNATVRMAFDNKEADHLGMPLPKGTVRVYKNDSAGQALFVGEDAIDHTPKGETVHLNLGQAFDVTAQPQADRVRAALRPRLRGRLRDRGQERQEGAGHRDRGRAVPGPMEDDQREPAAREGPGLPGRMESPGPRRRQHETEIPRPRELLTNSVSPLSRGAGEG